MRLKFFSSEKQIICSSILKMFSISVANTDTEYYSVPEYRNGFLIKRSKITCLCYTNSKISVPSEYYSEVLQSVPVHFP